MDPFYYQDDKPVREMSDIAGHAVRCMYLYCGMADVAALKQDSGYIESLNRLWDDVVLRNMYITGGIGSSRHNEGFTEDYDLPNLDAYCETCASVGMVLWNQRMNQFTGDSKYIDVLERSMYNGALAGISLEGGSVFSMLILWNLKETITVKHGMVALVAQAKYLASFHLSVNYNLRNLQ